MPEPQTTAAEPASPAQRPPISSAVRTTAVCLRDGNFSLEVTVFETGVPPELHVYPYVDDKPIDPSQVQLNMAVSRLGGEVNRFNFQPREDYLRADAVLHEPHSFDVTATASYGGAAHNWSYESYEGRTTIAAGRGRCRPA